MGVLFEDLQYEQDRAQFRDLMQKTYEDNARDMTWRQRRQFGRVLRSNRRMELLEEKLGTHLIVTGKMRLKSQCPDGGCCIDDDSGLFVDMDFGELWQIIIETLPKILEFIAGIAAIFML